ncbi:MAG: hypothetical protein ACRD3V_05470 [Vicinamibacteria bacterium]
MGLALVLAHCEDSGTGGNNGTGGSVTITAPGIVSPDNASPTADSQPTLTVTNATVSSGATPTYTFQVATDQAFSSIVAQASGIPQASGQTSWDVSQPLGSGAYFWRARAEASATPGPFSSIAQFTVAVAGGGAGETLVVFDDLMDGSTLATDRGGGSFTPQGWRVDGNGDFLRYEVPTVENGYVQWENVGLTERGANDASHMLFGMWDPAAGAYRQNAFRVHLQKLWTPPHNPPFLRFRWISQGREEEAVSNFNDYNPSTVYTWRIDWGPSGAANVARVFLNGEEILSLGYNRPYQPGTHWIELGVQERHESVIDAIYRNLAIVRR